MSRRTFMVLGALTAALVVTVLVLSLINRAEYAPTPSERLLPTLEERLNTITRLQIRSAGAQPVTLERQGERWQVVEKGGYPADFGLLRSQLLALARLDKIEAMTKNPDRYQKLGLQDVDQSGSEAREIRLWAGDKELAAVLIGETGLGGGSYARLVNEPQSWLTSGAVTLPAKAEEWLNKDLLNIIPSRVHRIAVQPLEGPAYTLTKENPQQTEFKLDPAPEPGKPLKPFEAQRAASALNALRLDDVAPEREAPQSDAPWQQARVETFDGLVIEAASRKVNDRQYAKLSARFDPALAERFKGAQQSASKDVNQPMVVELEGSALQPPDRVKAEAERLQQRFAGWMFVIPEPKATLLSQARDKLIETPAAAQAPPPATPSAESPDAETLPDDTTLTPDEEQPLGEEEDSAEGLPMIQAPPGETAPDDELAPPVEELPAGEAPGAGERQ